MLDEAITDHVNAFLTCRERVVVGILSNAGALCARISHSDEEIAFGDNDLSELTP